MYNVLIEGAAEAEDEFLEAAEAFAV